MAFIEIKKGDNKADVIRKNLLFASKMRDKIKLLDNSLKNVESISFEEEKEEVIHVEEVEEDEDYKYYYDNIMDAIGKCKSKEDFENAIYENLPIIQNGDYINIVRRIILELIKEKNLLEQLKDGEGENEVLSLCSEQERLDYIIGLIRKHRNYEKVEQENNPEQRNHLVFLKTSSGNIYAESDLASIDARYYPVFKELLESIENGTFKKVKRLSSNEQALKGIAEVKDFKTRVVFDRIDVNTYIIIDIFVKKSDCDNGYLEQLLTRTSYYQSVKKNLRDKISLEEHDIIYANIKSGLDKKVITKTKRGE